MLKKILYRLCLGEKILTPERFGKKISTKSVKWPIPDSPTNVQWSCQPFRGWGKKRIWHLSKCHPSTKWLARVHHVVVFKTKVLHFKIENTPIKDTNGKGKFLKNAQFPEHSLWHCLSRNSTLFSTDRSTWLVLNQQGSEVSEDTWGTFRTLWSNKTTFSKGNFCILKVSWTVSTFWHRRERKTTRLIFCHVLDRFNLTYANCFSDLFRINLWVFE